MELTLPSKLNASETIVLDTNVLVVIGANGAGKSSFGRDLLERYSDNSKRYPACTPCLSAVKNLCLSKVMNWHACNR